MSAGRRGTQLLIWTCVFTVLCAVCIGLRFRAAVLSRRRVFLDDYLVLFALANIISLEGVVIWAVVHGLGKHTDELSSYESGIQLKFMLASRVTWLLGTVFIKLSVLWLYTRIFSKKNFKLWAHIMMGIVGCYGVAFLILLMTQCRPISHQWDPISRGSCRSVVVQEMTAVSLNMVIDIAIVIMPLSVLCNLQLSLRSKLVVSGMFSIGLIIIGIIAWRIQFTASTRSDTDFAFNLFDIGLSSLLELWLGIIAACIPTLEPLLKTYVKPVLTKLTEISDGNNIRSQGATVVAKADRGSTLYGKKRYSQIEEQPSGSFHTNGTEIPTVTTKIKYDPKSKVVTEMRGVIYVQHDVEAHSKDVMQ